MRQYIQGLAVSLTVITITMGVLITTPQQAVAEILSTEDALAERTIGNADAPITIIEYASLGCSHCKTFHEETYPTLKKDYIDTGKVRMIFRDYPLGNRALAAAMLARCAPKERYFGMVSLFFQKQSDWGQSEDAIGALTSIAKFGGLSKEDVMACLENQDLIDQIRERAEDDAGEFGIEATPTFIIGDDQEKISGALPLAQFKEKLDALLAQ